MANLFVRLGTTAANRILRNDLKEDLLKAAESAYLAVYPDKGWSEKKGERFYTQFRKDFVPRGNLMQKRVKKNVKAESSGCKADDEGKKQRPDPREKAKRDRSSDEYDERSDVDDGEDEEDVDQSKKMRKLEGNFSF